MCAHADCRDLLQNNIFRFLLLYLHNVSFSQLVHNCDLRFTNLTSHCKVNLSTDIPSNMNSPHIRPRHPSHILTSLNFRLNLSSPTCMSTLQFYPSLILAEPPYKREPVQTATFALTSCITPADIMTFCPTDHLFQPSLILLHNHTLQI